MTPAFPEFVDDDDAIFASCAVHDRLALMRERTTGKTG